MKLMVNIVFIMVIIGLSSCASSEIAIDNLEVENFLYSIDESSLQKGAAVELDDIPTNSVESSIEYEDSIVFVTTARIHEDMPYFTFTRIIGDDHLELMMNNPYLLEIPSKEITIVIKDENNNVIQVIPGLTQAKNYLNIDLTFEDLNFDGYLDIRLLRWSEGAGRNYAYSYYWLWDEEEHEFVLNEQLIEIGIAIEVYIDEDKQQIVVFNKASSIYGGHCFDYYEFVNGNFTLVSQLSSVVELDENHRTFSVIITHKDLKTGITTVEIEPYLNE